MKDKVAIILDCFGLFTDDGFVLYFDNHFEGEEANRLKCRFCDDADLGRNKGLYDVISMMSQELNANPKTLHDEIIGRSIVHPDMIDLALRLKERHHVALLSNCMAAMLEEVFKDHPFNDCFDSQFRSYQVGLAKPDPKIYECVLQHLKDYDRILFFDDNSKNVKAAQEAGIEAYVFTAVTAAEALLKKEGLL